MNQPNPTATPDGTPRFWGSVEKITLALGTADGFQAEVRGGMAMDAATSLIADLLAKIEDRYGVRFERGLSYPIDVVDDPDVYRSQVERTRDEANVMRAAWKQEAEAEIARMDDEGHALLAQLGMSTEIKFPDI